MSSNRANNSLLSKQVSVRKREREREKERIVPKIL